MVQNENDFLGVLINCADENHDCDISDILNESGMSDIDCLPFIKSLESKTLIKTLDFETIHIYPSAYEAYVAPTQEIKKSLFETSKFTLKTILEIIVGIVITAAGAFIIYHFGWN